MTGSDFFVCIILVAVGLFMSIGILCAIRNEKQGFNNGICPICGEKLKHFGNDSQVVEDIAAHPQSIDITLGFHVNSLIKIFARKIANYEQR